MESNIKLLLRMYYVIENERFIQESCYGTLGVRSQSVINEVVDSKNDEIINSIKESNEYKNFVKMYFPDKTDVTFGEVFNHLKKYKYETLNYLLKLIKEDLDEYYVENFNEIINMINDNFSYSMENKQRKKDYKIISIQELQNLIDEFLVELDSSEEIGNLFADLVNKGKLHLEQHSFKTDTLQGSYDPFRNEINVEYEGNILDFIKIIHEFTHYLIEYYNSHDYLLVEFPAEYMENLAAHFLVKKGYASSVEEILDFRNADSIIMSSYELDILKTYLNAGKVTKEDMERIAKDYKDGTMNTFKMLMDKVDVPEKMIEIMEKSNQVEDEKIINDLIESFIAKNYFDIGNITTDLDYSIGRYLTRHANFNLEDEYGYKMACSTIRKIIKNYKNLTVNQIERELGIVKPLNKTRALK
jgi:hypothetical protein